MDVQRKIKKYDWDAVNLDTVSTTGDDMLRVLTSKQAKSLDADTCQQMLESHCFSWLSDIGYNRHWARRYSKPVTGVLEEEITQEQQRTGDAGLR